MLTESHQLALSGLWWAGYRSPTHPLCPRFFLASFYLGSVLQAHDTHPIPESFCTQLSRSHLQAAFPDHSQPPENLPSYLSISSLLLPQGSSRGGTFVPGFLEAAGFFLWGGALCGKGVLVWMFWESVSLAFRPHLAT